MGLSAPRDGDADRNRPLEVLAGLSFLSTVVLTSTLMPQPWVQGAVVGLGVGLLMAFAVYVRTSARAAGRATEPALRLRTDGELAPLRPDGSGLPERRRADAPPLDHPGWDRRRTPEPAQAERDEEAGVIPLRTARQG